MNVISGNPKRTGTIVHQLRLLADQGGLITQCGRLLLMEAADRLEDLDERVAIMTELRGEEDEKT